MSSTAVGTLEVGLIVGFHEEHYLVRKLVTPASNPIPKPFLIPVYYLPRYQGMTQQEVDDKIMPLLMAQESRPFVNSAKKQKESDHDA